MTLTDTRPGAFTQDVREGIGSVADLAEAGDRHEVLQEFPLHVVDSFGTVWLPDTFTRSWEARLPALCWMHDLHEPIGRATEAQVVAQNHRGERVQVAQVRSLFSRFQHVPLAERAYWQMKDGDLRDVSFGFNELAPRRLWRGANGERAMAIPRARMNETSPVTVGSLPGATVTGLREEGTVTVPTLQDVLAMKREGLIDEAGAAALLRDVLPEGLREHILVQSTRHDPAADGGGDGGTGDEEEMDPEQCALAVDAALDAAQDLVDGADTDTWPDDAQQLAALVTAAGVAADELLDAMGVEDPDDGGDSGERADTEQGTRAAAVSDKPWSQFSEGDYTPAQYKAACLIDTGEGAPDSKDRYALPVREPDGTLNKNALAAAAGRLGQVKAAPEKKAAAAKTLVGLYNQVPGMSPPPDLLKAAGGSGSREAPDQQVRELQGLFGRHLRQPTAAG